MSDTSNKIKGGLGGAAQGAAKGFQMGGPWGAVAGAVIGGVLGAMSQGNTPHAYALMYHPADVTKGQQDFLGQRENLAGVSDVLQQANRADNASFQKDASEFAPNLLGNIQQQGQNTAAMLGGQLTPGVQAALGKPGASARDLGITSDQLMRLGAGSLGSEVKGATGLNPFNETSTDSLLSPAALLAREDKRLMYNNQLQNQQSIIDFGATDPNDTASIMAGIGSSLGLVASQKSGQAPAGMGTPSGFGNTNPFTEYNGPMGRQSDGSYIGYDLPSYPSDGGPSYPPEGGGLSNSFDYGGWGGWG